jgi:hypothetical protein
MFSINYVLNIIGAIAFLHLAAPLIVILPCVLQLFNFTIRLWKWSDILPLLLLRYVVLKVLNIT